MLWYHDTWEGLQHIYKEKLKQDQFKNCCYWINPKQFHSIKNVPHIHFVFPKRTLKYITRKLANSV